MREHTNFSTAISSAAETLSSLLQRHCTAPQTKSLFVGTVIPCPTDDLLLKIVLQMKYSS